MDQYTVKDLIGICKKKKISGYSNKNKAQLYKLCVGRRGSTRKRSTPSRKRSASSHNVTVAQLRQKCKTRGISGYSTKTKAQLVQLCNHPSASRKRRSSADTRKRRSSAPKLSIAEKRKRRVERLHKQEVRDRKNDIARIKKHYAEYRTLTKPKPGKLNEKAFFIYKLGLPKQKVIESHNVLKNKIKKLSAKVPGNSKDLDSLTSYVKRMRDTHRYQLYERQSVYGPFNINLD